MAYSPTPLDIALAQDPIAEADSRAVVAAATPPQWTQVDVAARNFQKLLQEARHRMAEEESRLPGMAPDQSGRDRRIAGR